MFRAIRNFPRINDKGNVVTEPQINVFVADGVNDTSNGVWISPNRNVTTEDGTLHIALMNPFEGAQVSIGSGGVNCAANPTDPQCTSFCTKCNCQGVLEQLCADFIANGQPCPFTNAECIFSGSDPSCFYKCRITSGNPPFTQVSYYDCSGNPININDGVPYDCATVIPPDVQSRIIRAVERFILEMDLSAMANVSPSSINSATLRLPIKNKLDWM